MLYEMRTYTINGGMLDSYLELFNKQIVPNHVKFGIPVIAAWINRGQNEVTWVRTFANRDDRKAKLDVYEVSPERDAVFPIAAYHMAKVEIRMLENALNAPEAPDQSVLENEVAIKARAIFDKIPKEESDKFKASVAAPR